MKTYILVPFLALVGACGIPERVLQAEVAKELEARDSALCGGLKAPVDDLVDAIISNKEKTPDEVIIKGTVVIRGYDEGCR